MESRTLTALGLVPYEGVKGFPSAAVSAALDGAPGLLSGRGQALGAPDVGIPWLHMDKELSLNAEWGLLLLLLLLADDVVDDSARSPAEAAPWS